MLFRSPKFKYLEQENFRFAFGVNVPMLFGLFDNYSVLLLLFAYKLRFSRVSGNFKVTINVELLQ